MTEPPPRSRATVFVQVLVAALFLAVIGGSVGLGLGLRERDRDNTGPDNTGADRGGTSQPAGGSPGVDPPTPCPDEAGRQAGRGDLAQVLRIETEASEVWICRAGDGALYYLGRRFSDGAQQFLPDVRQQGDEYLATNKTDGGTTVYRVSRERLVIDDAGGEPQVQRVVAVDG